MHKLPGRTTRDAAALVATLPGPAHPTDSNRGSPRVTEPELRWRRHQADAASSARPL
ncbi:hypothetical protein AB0H86_26000 [Streptomyces sp. NPDC050997]|uniref:hypothetical protein n=1 Tax=Streptomyces sp. NPDC050997 TaxID=3155519 RepID=UPI00342641DE